MKKIVSIMLVMLVMVTNVFASTGVPEFLTELNTNYTGDYSISMTFDSSYDIVALLEELEMPEEVNYYVDMKTLLQTLFSYEGKMKLQADFSEDYEKIKIALTTDSVHKIDINPNLNVGVNAKTGMWMDIDLSDEENPVFDVIYSYPFMNKYVKVNGAEVIDSDTMDTLKAVFSKQYIESISKNSMELFAQYATIKGSGNKYTVTMDNEGLTSYIDKLMAVISKSAAIFEGEFSTEIAEFPSTKNWQILGKDGIQCVYTLKGGRISSVEEKADISVDISKIYTDLTGEEWSYNSTGKLDFTVDVSSNLSKIGSTEVELPVLTEENSISFEDLQPDYTYDDSEYINEKPEYPLPYVSGSCDNLPIIDGEIYVPLRLTLEEAYEDSVVIDYNNGVITVTSGYFPDFDNLTITIGDDKVYADDTEYSIGNAILIDGKTYVNNSLFCDIFGWRLTTARHDLIIDSYYYWFYTYTY